MLQQRSLGSSGIKVSLLGLGGNVFGPPRLDVDQTRLVIDAALDAGVNFVDTAIVYGQGNSELYLGEVLEGRRDRMVIATKFNLRGLEGPVGDHIRSKCDESLRKLRTDVIDLYQIHQSPPDSVDMVDIMEALDGLVRAGKVRAIGASNFASWRLSECAHISKDNGFASFATVQNYWHMLARGLEAEVGPFVKRSGMGVLPYHPLGGGYLTGKYVLGQEKPEGTRGAAGLREALERERHPVKPAHRVPDAHRKLCVRQQRERRGRVVGARRRDPGEHRRDHRTARCATPGCHAVHRSPG